MKIWIGFCLATALPAALWAGDAMPQDGAYRDEVHQRLAALEAQLNGMQRLPAPVQVIPAAGAAAPAGDLACPACGQAPQACACNKAAADGKDPTVKITGFFHLDAGYYSQDQANRDTLGDIQDGLGFRRARLAAVGNVTETNSYVVEFDFAQAQPRFVDVWMQFAETPVGNIRIGRFRQPFGMAELTSIRELPFLERETGFAFAPFRQTGVMLFDTALDENVTWAVSGYRELSDNFGNVYADNGGYGAAVRITGLPFDFGDDRLVHLGVDYSYNDPGRDIAQYASTNEFFVGQNPNLGPAGLSVLPIVGVPPFVNTGPIPTDHTNLFNVEGAMSLGRLVFQSEARWAVVEQQSGVSDTFPAVYAQVRYVITGEVIPYNHKAGVFGRVKPLAAVDCCCGQWGAWEIAARFSSIDLNGTALPGPGRRLNNTTLGLNWYLSDHTKFQFNWIHSDLSDPVQADSSADTLAIRGQIDF